MNKYISIRDQFCPNIGCFFYKKLSEGNVTVHGQKYPRFKCNHCNKTWVSSFGSDYYGLRKSSGKVESVRNLLNQNFSIRKISKIAGVSPGTVQRWKSLFFNQSKK